MHLLKLISKTNQIPLELFLNNKSNWDAPADDLLDVLNVQNGTANKLKQKQYRILLVEDNPIAQKAVQSILKQFDCEVVIASYGKEAIKLWQNNSYDLIFMDIGLPDMDGYEITRFIRMQETTPKNSIPIIALTAHSDADNKKQCIESGMNAVFTKPFMAKNWLDIIDVFSQK